MANEKFLKGRFQQKTDIEKNWEKAKNFIPLDGEIIVYSDLNKIKIGDGVTKVNDLTFVADDKMPLSGKVELSDDLILSGRGGFNVTENFGINCHNNETRGIYFHVADYTENTEYRELEILGTHSDELVQIHGIANPTHEYDVANKQYVDDQKFNNPEAFIVNILLTINEDGSETYILEDLNWDDIVSTIGENKTIIGRIHDSEYLYFEELQLDAYYPEDGYISFSNAAEGHIHSLLIYQNENIDFFKFQIVHKEDLTWENISNKPEIHKDSCLGFYWSGYDEESKILTLSTSAQSMNNRPRTWTEEAGTLLESWAVGDDIVVVNDVRCTLIATIAATDTANGTITVEDLTINAPEWEYENRIDNYAVYCPASYASGLIELATGAINLGINSSATGEYAFATGSNNLAAGRYSSTFGENNIAGYGSQAEGFTTKALGYYSHTEGANTKTLDYAAHAEGESTIAIGLQSHAEGLSTVAEGHNSHSEGAFTKAVGRNSHAEGYYSEALKDFAHAEGRGTGATNEAAHSEGYYTVASGLYSHSEGRSSTAQGDQSHAEGWETKAIGISSHAEGAQTKASNEAAHAEGMGSEATGYYSHAEGYYTEATRIYAHAEGDHTKAYGEASHAEGSETKASGLRSHAEGVSTTASGENSHAEGSNSTASGLNSHAEGNNTTATQDGAHSEGFSTTASGRFSHAEGTSSQAQGEASHAEGITSQAIGVGAHAEGSTTIARGAGSHSEGGGTEAKGRYSHAEGLGTIANKDYQHVQGKYNVVDETTNGYAHIIGGGTSTNRKNIHTVDWNGNAVYAGSITANGHKLPTFYSGTTEPTNDIGNIGDIYFVIGG